MAAASMSDLDDLVVGGYMVVVPAAVPSRAGLPGTVVTVSGCLMDAPEHEFFGWFTDATEATARCAGTPSARVVTVGIARRDTHRLVAQFGGPDVEHFDAVRRAEPFPGDAVLLGHEVVGVEQVFFVHSWHCYDYTADVADALGVTVDAAGLLADRTDALRVRDWMLALPPDDQPAPVPWIVVALAA